MAVSRGGVEKGEKDGVRPKKKKGLNQSPRQTRVKPASAKQRRKHKYPHLVPLKLKPGKNR